MAEATSWPLLALVSLFWQLMDSIKPALIGDTGVLLHIFTTLLFSSCTGLCKQNSEYQHEWSTRLHAQEYPLHFQGGALTNMPKPRSPSLASSHMLCTGEQEPGSWRLVIRLLSVLGLLLSPQTNGEKALKQTCQSRNQPGSWQRYRNSSSNHYSFVNNGQSSEWGTKQTSVLVQFLTWVSSWCLDTGKKLKQDCLTHSLLFCKTNPAGCSYFFPTCSWDAFGVSHGLKVTSAAGYSRKIYRQLPIHLHILACVQQRSQKFSPQEPPGAELLSLKKIRNRGTYPQMGSA